MKIKNIIATIILMAFICGCGCEKGEKISNDFILIEENYDYSFNTYKLYDKETKVIYLYIVSGYQAGLTPLYNADGTLQLYNESHYAKITGKDYTIPKKPGTQVIYLDDKED